MTDEGYKELAKELSGFAYQDDRVNALARHFGKLCAHAECPEYPISAWRSRVACHGTLLGYWDWVYDRLDDEGKLTVESED